MNVSSKWSATLALALLPAVGLLGRETSALSTIVESKKEAHRNPVTEISVDFGDVSHISPWYVKRRFPRSASSRGGQLVTLRDALMAVNEFVARDDEMPEHTFAFAQDGSLSSVCDEPFGAQSRFGVRLHGPTEQTFREALPADLLNTPVREFTKVEFFHATGTQPAAAQPAAGRPAHAAAGVRRTGDTKTIILPGGAKMEMIWCAPGSFLMGSPKTEDGRFEDELQHPVKLTKGFWLGKYEVTQEQWTSVMGSNTSRFKGDKRPVDSVSWVDCQAFIRKVNGSLGGAARLPTEAEWEYACRAGSPAAVSGSGYLDEMAWYDKNSESQTHEVGKGKQPNEWGFYDMHGNVLEWCSDWFGKAEEQEAVDPKGPTMGSFRVLRGGCWFYFARDCRSAYRLKRAPDIRNCVNGFRLACSPSAGE